MKKRLRLWAVFLLVLLLAGCGAKSVQEPAGQAAPAAGETPEVVETLEAQDEEAVEAVGAQESSDTEAVEEGSDSGEDEQLTAEESALAEDGVYSSKEEVAEYLYLYGHLPPNFITKKEAEALGWKGGSLEPFAPGKCIGGNRFGNYEGLLPEKEGRFYTECDIDTLGADRRGARRIVFSNDGLIYYTEDHYQSFELLYGEE